MQIHLRGQTEAENSDLNDATGLIRRYIKKAWNMVSLIPV